MSDSLQLHVLWPNRLLCPWDLPARILEWVVISKETENAKVKVNFKHLHLLEKQLFQTMSQLGYSWHCTECLLPAFLKTKLFNFYSMVSSKISINCKMLVEYIWHSFCFIFVDYKILK